MVLLPQSSEDNELLFKALLAQFKGKKPVPYKSSRIVYHLCSVFIYFAFL